MNRYCLVGISVALFLGLGSSLAMPPLLVQSWVLGNNLHLLDMETGAVTLWPIDGEDPNSRAMVWGPDELVYITGWMGYTAPDGTVKLGILRFTPSGRLVDQFVPGWSGGWMPVTYGMAFGPEGDLFVTSERYDGSGSSGVFRFDGITGQPKGIDPTNPDSGLFLDLGREYGRISDIRLGPDGMMYGKAWNGQVFRFDPSGDGTSEVLTTSDASLSQIGFDAAGHLLVPVQEGFSRFDLDTLETIDLFLPLDHPGPVYNWSITPGPEGNVLYVSAGSDDSGDGDILRFDAATGEYLGSFPLPLVNASRFIFIPEPGTLLLLAAGAGLVLRRRR